LLSRHSDMVHIHDVVAAARWALLILLFQCQHLRVNASKIKHTQFHCDLVSHFTNKGFVEKREDLLDGNHQLRLMTVGIPLEEIASAFHDECTRQPFDLNHKQPFGPSALLATWTCGSTLSNADQILVAEFSDANQWGPAQWEEFRARATARAIWDQPLTRANWFDHNVRGWHFDSWSSEISPNLRVFAALIRGTDPTRFSSVANLRKYMWNVGSYPPVQDIRDALVKNGMTAVKNREYQRGREDQKREDENAYERGRAQGRRECSNVRQQDARPAWEAMVDEFGIMTHPLDVEYVQEKPKQKQKTKPSSVAGTPEQSKAWQDGYKAAYNEQPDASPNCPACPECPPAPSCPLYEDVVVDGDW
jgi:hypothetical protein